MAGLTVEALPRAVGNTVQEVARFLGVTPKLLFVADHNHEGLSDGAFTVAYEGDYDWPFRFTEAVYAGEYEADTSLFLEAGTGWFLAMYPATD